MANRLRLPSLPYKPRIGENVPKKSDLIASTSAKMATEKRTIPAIYRNLSYTQARILYPLLIDPACSKEQVLFLLPKLDEYLRWVEERSAAKQTFSTSIKRNEEKHTSAERVLFGCMKRWGMNKRGNRMRFYQQYPLFGYVVDLFCIKAMLAIEVDGLYHFSDKQAARDKIRDSNLARIGVKTMRISNTDVMNRDIREQFFTSVLNVCNRRHTCMQAAGITKPMVHFTLFAKRAGFARYMERGFPVMGKYDPIYDAGPEVEEADDIYLKQHK